jgi:DNA polymerase V
MKSFYASVSAVILGLDPLTCYLAVVGDKERSGSVVLAASPALKRDFGIKTGNRLFEIPDNPRIHVVNPRMKLFLKTSTMITKLFSMYVPEADIHTYSVDCTIFNFRECNKEKGSNQRGLNLFWIEPIIFLAVHLIIKIL